MQFYNDEYQYLFHLVINANKTDHWLPIDAHHGSSKKINHSELCSCSENLLAKHAFNLETNGGCSFPVVASFLWNSLPDKTKNCTAVNNFKLYLSMLQFIFDFMRLSVVFSLFLDLALYANKFETREKQKLGKIEKWAAMHAIHTSIICPNDFNICWWYTFLFLLIWTTGIRQTGFKWFHHLGSKCSWLDQHLFFLICQQIKSLHIKYIV